MAKSSTICSSSSRWPVRILLDTPSYVHLKVKAESYNPNKILVSDLTCNRFSYTVGKYTIQRDVRGMARFSFWDYPRHSTSSCSWRREHKKCLDNLVTTDAFRPQQL